MKKALLVIDMQEICIGENHAEFFKYGDSLLTAVNEVIAKNKDNTVIYIRNLMKKNVINKFAPVQVYDGSKEAELAKGLLVVSDNVFDKYQGDAFSNEKLNAFLTSKGIDTVEIVGADGGGCAALTALGAQKKGYNVIMNTKAIGTVFEKKRDAYYDKLKKAGAEFI